jgi:membrane protein YdbS with pleckstrin-like domain
MAFPKRLLIEGEELVLDLRPHPVALVFPAFIAVLGFAAATWLTTRDEIAWWVGWAGFLILLLVYVGPRFLNWWTSLFAVTSDRIIHRSGWISKYSMEIPLEAINDVRFEQGVIDRMVGAGSLVIQSASEQGRQVFEDVRDPEGVQRTIYHQGELNKKRMYQGEGQPAPAAPSVTSELERLARLHADGVLTDEEFATQKAKILGQG